MMRKYLFLSLILFIGWGCSDFLDPKSQSEYVPKDAVSIGEMLLGEGYPTNFMAYHTFFDDDVNCSDTPSDYQTWANTFITLRALFSWQPDAFITAKQYGGYHAVWETIYTSIRGTNAALDYIGQVEGTWEEKAWIEAEARALRAFHYFHLVNLWGNPYHYNKKGLSVPLRLTSSMEYKEVGQATVEEVYNQILEDLTQAEELYVQLPEKYQFERNNRINLPTVLLLMSRVYLYMEEWALSAQYARKVIEEWNFQLFDLNHFETTTTVPYYNFISFDCPEVMWMFGGMNDAISYLNAYTAGIDEFEDKNIRKFNAAPDLLESFLPGDLRKENYIVTDYENKDNYLVYGKFSVTYKHAPVISEFPYAFRLPEAYLNLAEALAKQTGKEKEALEVLNTLRKKRFSTADYLPVENLTGEALVERVRLERRLELCFEGHRWFDLRRYGMPSFSRAWKNEGKIVQVYTLEKEDPFYTLPIPQVVLERNRALIQHPLSNPR